jgi:hypothetical protein
MPTDRLNGWIVTLIIGAIAFVLRFINLGYPNKLVFDETYYAKDAYSLLKFGYERGLAQRRQLQDHSGRRRCHEGHGILRGAPAARQMADRRG